MCPRGIWRDVWPGPNCGATVQAERGHRPHETKSPCDRFANRVPVWEKIASCLQRTAYEIRGQNGGCQFRQSGRSTPAPSANMTGDRHGIAPRKPHPARDARRRSELQQPNCHSGPKRVFVASPPLLSPVQQSFPKPACSEWLLAAGRRSRCCRTVRIKHASTVCTASLCVDDPGTARPFVHVHRL